MLIVLVVYVSCTYHICVGSEVARFDYNGQFLGPQAVERVTGKVSTLFCIWKN